ncbi:hypothetical protein ASZ90_018890 [hydrocarbon metagenome]|uniref:Uncharacterized protein n=1 Tax=hydrocarbon metagenome TaxID=938273 RepID=A0A0W8E4X9_9ZZZZ
MNTFYHFLAKSINLFYSSLNTEKAAPGYSVGPRNRRCII